MQSHHQPSLPTSALDAGTQAVWLQVGHILDAANRRCLRNAHLLYDASGILHLGERPPPPALAQGRVPLPLPYQIALPPLFDAHTHINLCGGELDAEKRKAAQSAPPEQLLAEASSRADAIARMGVRAMRDGGDKDGVGLALSRQARTGEHPGARVFSPGPGIHRKGRYGSFFSRPVEDYPCEADCVEARAAEGADHIKIVPTGIINFAKGSVTARPQFTAAEVAAFQQAARIRHLALMAHASGEEGIGNAINGGVDTLEHGYFITRDQLAMMRDRGIAWVPTFAPVYRQVVHADVMGWNADILDALHRILDAHAQSLQLALTMGIEILVGSDAGSYGVPHATGLFEEIWLVSQAGMPPLEALCRAIHDNPVRLAPDLAPADLAVGREPNFLLAPAGAMEDARQLTQATVIRDGARLSKHSTGFSPPIPSAAIPARPYPSRSDSLRSGIGIASHPR